MMPLTVSVANSCITEPIHLQNVVGQTHQGPLPAYLIDSTQEKLSEAARLFDLAKDWFDDSLAPRVHRGTCLGLELGSHFVYARRSLRKWPTLAGTSCFSMLLFCRRYVDFNGLLLESLQMVSATIIGPLPELYFGPPYLVDNQHHLVSFVAFLPVTFFRKHGAMPG